MENVDSLEITHLDKSNERSIINLVNTACREAISAVPLEFWELDEKELKEACVPTATDDIIKISFWNEYENAQARNVNMDMVNVYCRACNSSYFYKKFLKNSYKVAWLLCPPKDYDSLQEALLYRGIQRQFEILELPFLTPIKDSKGNVHYMVDAKIAAVVHQVTKDVELRRFGAIPQFIKTQNTNVNVNSDSSSNAKDVAPRSMNELDHKIKLLEAQINSPGVIDINLPAKEGVLVGSKKEG